MQNNLLALLQSTGYPVAHNVFLQRQTPPYIIYLDDKFDYKTANSKTVLKKRKITIELYTSLSSDVDTVENAVETVLDGFTTYDKNRTFDENQSLYITYYSFYEVIQ